LIIKPIDNDFDKEAFGLRKLNKNKLPRGRAIEVLKGVCFANIIVSDPEGRGIKPYPAKKQD